MSTETTIPAADTTGTTAGPGTTTHDEPTGASPAVAAPEPAEDGEPGWVARHTALLVTLLLAVIVVAVAVTGLVLHRDARADRNADTEAAFAEAVTAQGAALETVECDGDTCAAVVSGQAYTVLVQEDESGEQHFGVSAYVGD